jgi:hypothetical protein
LFCKLLFLPKKENIFECNRYFFSLLEDLADDTIDIFFPFVQRTQCCCMSHLMLVPELLKMPELLEETSGLHCTATYSNAALLLITMQTDAMHEAINS